MKKYYYNFDRLQSFDENILDAPIISIKTEGKVPRRPKGFTRFYIISDKKLYISNNYAISMVNVFVCFIY